MGVSTAFNIWELGTNAYLAGDRPGYKRVLCEGSCYCGVCREIPLRLEDMRLFVQTPRNRSRSPDMSGGLMGWDRQLFGGLEGSEADKMLGRCTGTFSFSRF